MSSASGYVTLKFYITVRTAFSGISFSSPYSSYYDSFSYSNS